MPESPEVTTAPPISNEPASSAAAGSAPEVRSAEGSNPIDDIKAKDLETRIIETLRTVYDPEIPVNIYEMGLIYTIRATAGGIVYIGMTLTSPACPVAGSLPIEVEQKVKALSGVTAAQVEIVWEPPWTPEMMSEAAKLQLGMM